MTSKDDSVIMSNGVKLPYIGLGTFLGALTLDGEWTHLLEKQKEAIRAALEAGYRHFDNGYTYTENELAVGQVLKEYFDAGKLKRSDIFLEDKLPFYGHERVEECVNEQLKNYGVDYLDLLHVHMPWAIKCDPKLNPLKDNLTRQSANIPLIDTWRELETLYKRGIVRSIGVSNVSLEQLKELVSQCEIKPHNLQVEMHIFLPQNELVDYCKRNNITVTAYGTFGSPGSVQFRTSWQNGIKEKPQAPTADLLNHPLVLELAKKYKKTSAQILTRQMIQRGVTTVPKSSNPGRVRENIQVFDFELSQADMKRFDQIKERIRLFYFDFAHKHPVHQKWVDGMENN